MNYLLITLGILLLILGILIFSILRLDFVFFAGMDGMNIKLSLKYVCVTVSICKNGETFSKILIINIFGLKFKKKLRQKKQVGIEANKKANNEEKETTPSIKIDCVYTIYQGIKEELKNVICYFTGKITFDTFKIITEIGTSDAAYTAIACGIFYSIFSPLGGIIYNSFKVKNINIAAIPHYDDEFLSANIHINLFLRAYVLFALSFKATKLSFKVKRINQSIQKGEKENE